MSVRIRLKRMGARKDLLPYCSCRFPCSQDGRFIEEIGYYNPLLNQRQLRLIWKRPKVDIPGGSASDTVKVLFAQAGFQKK